MAVSLTYHGTPVANLSGIMNTGFRPGSLLSIAPGQVFSTSNPAMASKYGTPLKMVTPKSAFSMPSGVIGTGIKGTEVIQSPSAATKSLNLASKLGTTYTGSTAQKLLAGQTVAGLGGIQNPALLSRILSSLGTFGKMATGVPGLAATGLYGLSQQMKPGSALSKFIKQGPTKYQKLQNELKLKQMQAQKKSLEDRFKKIDVEKVKKMTNYVTGQQLHGNLKGPKSDQKGKKGGINSKDPKGGIGGGLGGIHK